MDSKDYMIGFVAGLIGMLVLLSIIYKVKKEKKLCVQLDERQNLARGEAYKFAYITLLIYLIGSEFFKVVLDIHIFNESMNIFIGFYISICVFASICIVKNAYMTFKQKPKNFVILFCAVGLLNFFVGGQQIIETHGLFNAKGQIHNISIFCGIAFLYLGVLILVHDIFLAPKEEEE